MRIPSLTRLPLPRALVFCRCLLTSRQPSSHFCFPSRYSLHFHSEMPLRCAVTSGDWCCLAACTQLVHLRCCNNPMRGFLRLPPLPHLRSVDVSGSDVSGCDGLAACPLLERVVLFHTQMAEAPPSGVLMGSLCELFLNNCKLTWIRECPSLPLLRYLSLADNR